MKRFCKLLRWGHAVVLLLLSPVLLVASAIGWHAWELGANDSRVIYALEHANRVRVFRMDGTGEHGYISGQFPIAYEGRAQGPEFAHRLARAMVPVFRHRQWITLGMSGCEFTPTVAYKVEGDTSVTLVLCHGCSEVVLAPSPGQSLKTRKHFYSQRATLVRLAKEAFPRDHTIRQIEEKPF